MRAGMPIGAVLSALLLVLSFPGVDAGFLVLIALVPLLTVCWNSSPARAFITGWVTGMIWFFVSLNWLTTTLSRYGSIPIFLAQIAILLLAIMLGVYVGIFSSLIPISNRLGPLWGCLLLPSCWVLIEIVRSWVPAPFPWLLLGSAFWDGSFLKKLYPLMGVYGVSFLIVFVNQLALKIVEGAKERSIKTMVMYAGCIFAVIAFPVLISSGIHNQDPERSLKVAIVQGNFEQEVKWDESIREKTVSTYLELSREAALKGAQLILWPETALPFYYRTEPEIVQKLTDFAEENDVHLVFGSPDYEIRGRTIVLFNRAYHLYPDGREEKYDKIRLVPFGEYVPFKKVLAFVDRIIPGEGEFARGRWEKPFGTPVSSGALICFEISFPDLSRKEVESGAGLLLNITNDGWFGRSWGPRQHFVLSAVRAAENGVPVLRAANTGVSGVFAHDGSLLGSLALYKRGMLFATIKTGGKRTFYSQVGDWIVPVSVAVIIFSGLRIFSLRRSGRWNSWKRSKTT